MRGRLGQVLCAKSHSNRTKNRTCKRALTFQPRSSDPLPLCLAFRSQLRQTKEHQEWTHELQSHALRWNRDVQLQKTVHSYWQQAAKMLRHKEVDRNTGQMQWVTMVTEVPETFLAAALHFELQNRVVTGNLTNASSVASACSFHSSTPRVLYVKALPS